MATTVQEAFEQFNKNNVNLDPARTQIARKSREWLLGQLSSLPEKTIDFPKLFAGRSLNYGSFSRNTKIRPLNDIDMILTFSAQGTSYWEISYGTSYTLTVPEDATALKKLCNDDGTLNSIKFVNKLVSSLSGLEHYKSAAIHRKQEAATLSLSYEWTYDIVPAFYTDTGYYLIPDGTGGWKATDPRLDETRLNNLIQKHGDQIFQLIRTLKFWNLRASMTTIPSYLFENTILSFLESEETISADIDINIIRFLQYLKYSINYSFPDPKGFQGDLNTLDLAARAGISTKAQWALKKGLEANAAEISEHNIPKSISIWAEIFGGNFKT